MAALTIAARTPTSPPDGGRYNSLVLCKTISGTGGDDSEIVAGATGIVHCITGGHMTCNGADTVGIFSDASGTQIGSMVYPVADTLNFPVGVYTEAGEALSLNKVGAATTVWGSIEFVSIPAGQYVGVLP